MILIHFKISCRELRAYFFGDLVLFDERATSITTSHKSKANNPSILSPEPAEIISDSVEVWDKDFGWMCKKQTSVSHTSTESEKIVHPRDGFSMILCV